MNGPRMFFRVNIDYYPGNFNVYDSMGDCYLAANDKAKAIEYFEKALSIKYRPRHKRLSWKNLRTERTESTFWQGFSPCNMPEKTQGPRERPS